MEKSAKTGRLIRLVGELVWAGSAGSPTNPRFGFQNFRNLKKFVWKQVEATYFQNNILMLKLKVNDNSAYKALLQF